MESRRAVRALFLEDDRGVGELLGAALRDEGIDVVGHEVETDRLVAAALATRPDVVVADIDLGATDALELPSMLGPEGPPILWWSGHADVFRERALRAGGKGFISKRDIVRRLTGAIRRVADGGETWTETDKQVRASKPPFSERETEVLMLVAQGRTYDEIADELGISSRTVNSHLTRMYDRHGVSNQKELLATAGRLGWRLAR